jgi:hypothetical protein
MAVFETVKNVEELVDLLAKGSIHYETYEKMLPIIQERSAKLTETWENNLQKIRDSVSAVHDLDKAIELIDVQIKKLNTDTKDLVGEDFAENYLEGLDLAFEKTEKFVDKRSELNQDVADAFKNLKYEADMQDYKLDFDDEGNLLNGGEYLNQAEDAYYNAVRAAGPNPTQDQEKDIEAKRRALENIQNLISVYDKSREAVLNNEQAILDAWVIVKEKLYNAYAEAMNK